MDFENVYIKIINLGKSSQISQFFSKISSYCQQEDWLGNSKKFGLQLLDNQILISDQKSKVKHGSIIFEEISIDKYNLRSCEFSEFGNNDRIQELESCDGIIVLCDSIAFYTDYNIKMQISTLRCIFKRRKINYIPLVILLIDYKNTLSPNNNEELSTLFSKHKISSDNYKNSFFDLNKSFLFKTKSFEQRIEFSNYFNGLSRTILLQDFISIHTKKGKILHIPIGLLPSVSFDYDFGFFEAFIWTIFLYSKKNQLSIRIPSKDKLYYQILNNQTYINMKFYKIITDKLIRGNCKKIRLAVIGGTASGKSYLNQDFIAALESMHFTAKDNSGKGYSFVGQYYPDVHSKSNGLDRTPKYIAHRENHYMAKFQKDSESFVLEFIDIPGESCREKQINAFKSIAQALNRNTNKIFLADSWSKEDVTYKVLYTQDTLSLMTSTQEKVNETDNNTGLNLDSLNASKQEKTKKTQIGYFMSTDDVVALLKESGYKKNKEKEKVSGKDVFENFFDYYPDTVINAILDAWEKLSPVAPVDLKEHSAFKNSFRTDFSKDFYFLFYCLKATDIVICDKMALPKGVSDPNGNKLVFGDMANALSNLRADGSIREKDANWYLVLKGVDSIINTKDNTWKAFYGQYGHNYVYSLATFAIAAERFRMTGRIENDKALDNLFSELGITTDNTPKENKSIELSYICKNKEEASSLFTSVRPQKEDIEEHLQEAIYAILKKISKADSQLLKKSDEYRLMDKESLGKYITDRLLYFSRLTENGNDDFKETEFFKCLGLPPHVYFAGTPIDKDFNIHGHVKGKYNTFEGEMDHPEKRLCFGTYQLAMDILQNHGEIEPEDDYGTLLNYFFGLL